MIMLKCVLATMLFLSSIAYGEGMEPLFGGIRLASGEANVFEFYKVNNMDFTESEKKVVDAWFKKHLAGQTLIQQYGSEESRIFVPLSRETSEQVSRRTKGCFMSWLGALSNKAPAGTRELPDCVKVRASLSDASRPLSSSDLERLNTDFQNYTLVNALECEKTDPKNTQEPLFIIRGLEDYVAMKLGPIPGGVEESYDMLLNKTLKSVQGKISSDTVAKWMDRTQSNFIGINSEIMQKAIVNLSNSGRDNISETEFAFRFAMTAESVDNNLYGDAVAKAQNGEFQSLFKYIWASKYLFDACSVNGKYSLKSCNGNNFGNRFATIKIRRREQTYQDFLSLAK